MISKSSFLKRIPYVLKRRGFLICLTGMDGTGKTSHTKSLIEYIQGKGYSCKYVWGAPRPFLSYAFLVLTRMLGYWKRTKKNAYTDPVEYAPRNLAKKLSALWMFSLFFDFQFKATIKIKLPLAFGKVVVCDRYFYDLLMELQRSNVSSDEFRAILSKTSPKPLVTFLLDAPESLVRQRRGFASEELTMKRKVFQKIAKTFGFVILDSSKDFSRNQKRMRALTLTEIKKTLTS